MERFLRETEAPGLQSQMNCLAVTTNLPARWRSHFQVTHPALTELSQLVPHRTHGCLAKPGPDSRYVGKITDYCCLKPLTFGVITYPATDNCNRGIWYFIYASHYKCIFKLLLMSSFLLQSVLSPSRLQPLLFFFFSTCLFLFIYLIVPGHSCGTWDPPSSLQHVGSFSFGIHTHICCIWDLIPWPGIKLSSLHWECGVWCIESAKS